MDERLRQDGLTTQQAALITVVESAGEPSLTEAAASLSCTRQNVKQLARALKRKGFLELRVDPEDARITRLAVTRRSRDFWATRDSSDVEAVTSWFRRLDEHELRTLLTLIDRVLDGVSQSTEAAR